MSTARSKAQKPAAPPAPSWLTARADSGGVPALLERLVATVPVETMDEVWIFPTRRMPGFESTVVVLSLFTEEAEDRRRVATAHFKAVRNKRGEATVETILSDHAVAPPDRLERIIDGVLRRLGDDSVLATPPRSAHIRGLAERWTALVQAIEGGQEIPLFAEDAEVAFEDAETANAEISEVALEDAETALEDAETALEVAEVALEDAETSLEDIEISLEDAETALEVAETARVTDAAAEAVNEVRDDAHGTMEDVQTENEEPR